MPESADTDGGTRGDVIRNAFHPADALRIYNKAYCDFSSHIVQ